MEMSRNRAQACSYEGVAVADAIDLEAPVGDGARQLAHRLRQCDRWVRGRYSVWSILVQYGYANRGNERFSPTYGPPHQ